MVEITDADARRTALIFGSGERPPEWAELRRFRIIGVESDPLRLVRTERKERVLVTLGAVQFTWGTSSQVRSEQQFFDLPAGIDDVTLVLSRGPAEIVHLSGTWEDDLGGCGTFFLENEPDPSDGGDPVDYAKQTVMDSHYHDCDEYWIGLGGWGETVVSGEHVRLGRGECLAIRTGHHHDLADAPEGLRAAYFETTLTGKKRRGHLWEHTHGPAVPLPV